MKNYEEPPIDRDVLFLESFYETERRSRITTKDGVRYSRDSPLVLIDKACMLFASTYEGRVKATRHNLKQHKKTTLLISEDGLAAYPTKSPSQLDCVWIFNHQYRLEELSPTRTRIIYDQFGVFTEVNVSVHTLSKQRTRLYEMIYYYSAIRERNKG